jgi:hypothetical protein
MPHLSPICATCPDRDVLHSVFLTCCYSEI